MEEFVVQTKVVQIKGTVKARPVQNKQLEATLFNNNLNIIDTRRLSNNNIEKLPTKITGTYVEDYNILYIDEIIRKKLNQQKFTDLNNLKQQYKSLEVLSLKPQTYINREKTLNEMKKLENEINQIETGENLKIYDSKVKFIISEYKKYKGKIKTINIDEDNKYKELSDDVRTRLAIIDRYLDIASDYIELDVIRINNKPNDMCSGCQESLVDVAVNEDGVKRCPKCETEHNVVITTKLAKDGIRINTQATNDDDSIENFIKAFIRYQGLQPDKPPECIYDELDEYFESNNLPIGEEIRELPLDDRGRRGNTTHKMMWNALSEIGRSKYYEDTNYIAHIYWGWTLPNVMHLKELIINDYNITQKVYYQIPIEERGRKSSLGTQYRLWRHLQLRNHECYRDEFKLAENDNSAADHDQLWRMMCERANNPDIRYIL